jgi:hypothetical protein
MQLRQNLSHQPEEQRPGQKGRSLPRPGRWYGALHYADDTAYEINTRNPWKSEQHIEISKKISVHLYKTFSK